MRSADASAMSDQFYRSRRCKHEAALIRGWRRRDWYCIWCQKYLGESKWAAAYIDLRQARLWKMV